MKTTSSKDLERQVINQLSDDLQQAIDRAIMKTFGHEPSLLYQLIFDQGTVYGQIYYTVAPVWDETPYGDNPTWSEMVQWCVDTFDKSETAIWGESKAPDPMERWYVNNAKFWFRDQRDRDWFTLRWA